MSTLKQAQNLNTEKILCVIISVEFYRKGLKSQMTLKVWMSNSQINVNTVDLSIV